MTPGTRSAENSTTVPEESEDDFAWTLFVVHHDEHALPPIHLSLGRSQVASFARGGGSFGELPLDARLSRKHARFLVDGTGTLYVVDEGSRNGVHRAGQRISYAALLAGDVLRIGGFLLVVQPTLRRYEPSNNPLLPMPGATTGQLLQALQLHAGGAVPHIVLFGEEGCAAEAVARVWASAAGLSIAPADAPGEAAALWFSAAHRSAPDRIVRALRSGRRVVFDATGAPPAWSLPLALAGLPTAHLAPLRSRREDILATIYGRWIERGVTGASLSSAQAITLLLAPWPGNDAELLRVADALAERIDDATLSVLLCSDGSRRPPDDARVVVAIDGRRFLTATGEVVELHQRPVLARILRALASGGEPRSVHDLIEAAWPGASLVGDSGAARVYAAVATLRRLGLRDALARDAEGYRLDPERARIGPVVHSTS